MIIRRGTEVDAPAAARLHVSGISEGFLSTLGPHFLGRLYRRVARWPQSFLLVAEDGDGVVGFAAGAEDVQGLYRSFMLRDGLAVVAPAAPRMARSWRPVFETLRYPAGQHDLPRAELLAIAVEPAARGRGIGSGLVRAVTDEFSQRGIRAARVVVGQDNATAIRMYEAGGFGHAVPIAIHTDRPSQVLTWP